MCLESRRGYAPERSRPVAVTGAPPINLSDHFSIQCTIYNQYKPPFKVPDHFPKPCIKIFHPYRYNSNKSTCIIFPQIFLKILLCGCNIFSDQCAHNINSSKSYVLYKFLPKFQIQIPVATTPKFPQKFL